MPSVDELGIEVTVTPETLQAARVGEVVNWIYQNPDKAGDIDLTRAIARIEQLTMIHYEYLAPADWMEAEFKAWLMGNVPGRLAGAGAVLALIVACMNKEGVDSVGMGISLACEYAALYNDLVERTPLAFSLLARPGDVIHDEQSTWFYSGDRWQIIGRGLGGALGRIEWVDPHYLPELAQAYGDWRRESGHLVVDWRTARHSVSSFAEYLRRYWPQVLIRWTSREVGMERGGSIQREGVERDREGLRPQRR